MVFGSFDFIITTSTSGNARVRAAAARVTTAVGRVKRGWGERVRDLVLLRAEISYDSNVTIGAIATLHFLLL